MRVQIWRNIRFCNFGWAKPGKWRQRDSGDTSPEVFVWTKPRERRERDCDVSSPEVFGWAKPGEWRQCDCGDDKPQTEVDRQSGLTNQRVKRLWDEDDVDEAGAEQCDVNRHANDAAETDVKMT